MKKNVFIYFVFCILGTGHQKTYGEIFTAKRGCLVYPPSCLRGGRRPETILSVFVLQAPSLCFQDPSIYGNGIETVKGHMDGNAFYTKDGNCFDTHASACQQRRGNEVRVHCIPWTWSQWFRIHLCLLSFHFSEHKLLFYSLTLTADVCSNIWIMQS